MIKLSKTMLKYGDYKGTNGSKWSTIINNNVCMVKENTRNKISNNKRHKKYRRPNNKTVTGYNNSVYSEYIASNVINFLNFNGVKAHDVELGVDENDKIYNICIDFRYSGRILRYEAYTIDNILNGSKIRSKGKTIEGIINFIKEQDYVDKSQLLKYFWSMFILDALNLNRDRHVDNWGLLFDPLNQSWKIGKVYDNGSSLLAKGDLKEILMVVENPANYYNNETIKVLHSLKEKRKSHNRLNYREFLSTTDNKECLDILREFYEFLNIDWLLMFIDNLELDDYLKEYYKNIYKHSYELIIKYAYENNPNI